MQFQCFGIWSTQSAIDLFFSWRKFRLRHKVRWQIQYCQYRQHWIRAVLRNICPSKLEYKFDTIPRNRTRRQCSHPTWNQQIYKAMKYTSKTQLRASTKMQSINQNGTLENRYLTQHPLYVTQCQDCQRFPPFHSHWDVNIHIADPNYGENRVRVSIALQYIHQILPIF